MHSPDPQAAAAAAQPPAADLPEPDAAAPDADSGPRAFAALGLSEAVVQAVTALGYERPTPIQLRAIPALLAGRDLIAQAQTGTGKTAAFALPLLTRFRPGCLYALVLEPTRELALQVAQSFQDGARFIEGFQVLPVYGGAPYQSQLRALRHGVSVIVATPGRLIDLMQRGQADCSEVACVVLDEADEMLRMGFIEDVRWILARLPQERQGALFSATLPAEILAVARDHLHAPEEVRIEAHTAPASTVRQRYWVVSGAHKTDAITRMLEVEDYDAVLVFVRTKTDAEEVTSRLMARGLACVALHGDIPQKQREQIIARLRRGYADIIIATDVAARGLDIDRISHVFNYDIPYDAETYVHRIGRTGRAGRPGEAILFVTPRERRLLRQIERTIGQHLEPMAMPSAAEVNRSRLESFRAQLLDIIEHEPLERYQEVISDLLARDAVDLELLAAALVRMAQKNGRLFLDDKENDVTPQTFEDEPEHRSGSRHHRSREISAEAVPLSAHPELTMSRYRIAVGRRDGVRPSQIVGAIANEGRLDSEYIGEIHIYNTFCTVDLPADLTQETRRVLEHARVCGRTLELREYTREPPQRRAGRHAPEHEGHGPEAARPSRFAADPQRGRAQERSARRGSHGGSGSHGGYGGYGGPGGAEAAGGSGHAGGRSRSGKNGAARPYRSKDPMSSFIRTKKGRF